MIRDEQLQDMLTHDTHVVDQEGHKVGTVGQVYLDDRTNQPEWATVKTGMFGTSESFVPLQAADLRDGQLILQCGKDAVKDAPRMSADGHLSPEQAGELYRYYGLSDTSAETSGHDQDDRHVAQSDQPTTAGHDSGSDTGEAVTRSAEHVELGTEQRAAGQVRFRRHVVTEEVITEPLGAEGAEDDDRNLRG